MYLTDGSAQASLHAATLRQQLQIKLFTSSTHSLPTPGLPVPALTLEHQAPGRVATAVPILKSLAWLDPEKSGRKRNSNPGSFVISLELIFLDFLVVLSIPSCVWWWRFYIVRSKWGLQLSDMFSYYHSCSDWLQCLCIDPLSIFVPSFSSPFLFIKKKIFVFAYPSSDPLLLFSFLLSSHISDKYVGWPAAFSLVLFIHSLGFVFSSFLWPFPLFLL